MMETQMKLNLEDEVREFVGDFNKFFEELKVWTSNDVHIKTWKDHFLKEYPKIFNDSSENEVEMDIEVATTMETKPTIDREEKLRKVEEKLLSKKTNETLTRINYEDVINDPNLTLTQKIIYLQKGIDDEMRRKILYALLQKKLHEECFQQSQKVYEETLKKRRLRDSVRDSYENYTNLFSTTVNLTFALFLYVFFTVT